MEQFKGGGKCQYHVYKWILSKKEPVKKGSEGVMLSAIQDYKDAFSRSCYLSEYAKLRELEQAKEHRREEKVFEKVYQKVNR